MSRANIRFPRLARVGVFAVIFLWGVWSFATPARGDTGESATDEQITPSEDGIRLQTDPGQIVSPRTFEEELNEILSWDPYVYESMGRRDPFYPLVSSQESDNVQFSDLPDPRGLKLTGVLWGDKDRFALTQDWHNRSFVLREGDPVWNGHVVRIEQSSLVIRYNHFGMWKTITLHIQTGKEKSNGSER